MRRGMLHVAQRHPGVERGGDVMNAAVGPLDDPAAPGRPSRRP
jgi:hypothetical protein